MLELIILILSVVINSLLGLAVILQNPKKDMNRLFALITLSLSVWLVVTHFSVYPTLLSQLSWVRVVLASAAVLCYFVLTSFAVFPDGSFSKLKFIRPATIYLLFVIALTQTPFVFRSLEYNSQGAAEPVVSPGIAFFMLLALSYLGGAVYLLLKKLHRAEGVVRNQLRIVVFGVATSFTAILISNLFLVSIFKETSLISFAPLFTLILTGSMAYAILRHKLFDLRLAVARAMAYLLTFTFVITIYSGAAFFISSLFSVDSGSVSASQRFFYVALAVITAVAFQPLRGFFDKLTNRIFYRDSYEPQLFLDQLNKALVNNLELEILLRHTSRVIERNLKSSSCNFVINESEGNKERIIGNNEADLKSEDIEELREKLKKHHHKVVITDDLDSDHKPLRKYLNDRNISVAVSLVSGHNSSDKPLAYLLLGPKKSGNIYNKQDLRIIEIIADELIIAIQNALRFEEIQGFAATLQDKVNKATSKLQQTNKKLREMDETKDEFISMASHQLRTPLTSVKGYMSMVLEEDAGKLKKQQKQLLDQAFVSSQRMVYLIADLLNVSRLKTGKFIIDAVPTNLAEVVEGEVSQLRETAKRKNLTLNYNKPKDFPKLMLDETKIRQVIMNFSDNAIYYTPKGGEINIELKEDKKNVYFRVTDSGIGVPKKEKEHMFTKFYRAKNARKARPDGTGLGLFMAKKVVDAQGGQILFESEEGKGSTFGFCFNKRELAVKNQDKHK